MTVTVAVLASSSSSASPSSGRRSSRLASASRAVPVTCSVSAVRAAEEEENQAALSCGGSDSPTDSFGSSALLPGSSLLDPRDLELEAIRAAHKLESLVSAMPGVSSAHPAAALEDDEEEAAALRRRPGRQALKALDDVPLMRGTSGSQSVEGGEEWKWGRAMNNDWTSAVLAFAMMSLVPFVVLLMLHSCRYHECSIQASLLQAVTEGLSWSWIPPVSTRAWLIYVCWFLFQLLLYRFMPGPIDHGQPTNAGHTLAYRVNGWNAWFFSHACLLLAVYGLRLFPLTIVADEWFALFGVLNFFGYFWTIVAYLKAAIAPTHRNDCKSGSVMYDLFMGVEHNPRIADWFDFKLFFNGRPGILGWSIINLSFAAKQYEQHGYVSNSMLAVHLLHLTYILDFFYHEGWYLRTIDIAHDHFGFYLAWGDTVFLPMTYTLQSLYLLYHPVQLSTPALLAVLALGWSGYGVFRAVNNQKDRVRQTKGRCLIWGRPARYLEVHYSTLDGPRSSLLLTSGFWGLSRHFNYVGDLMISSAMCLACGCQHLLPFFYIIFMTIVLLHRVGRDHARCSAKYGPYWQEYCRLVPYKVLPYVY